MPSGKIELVAVTSVISFNKPGFFSQKKTIELFLSCFFSKLIYVTIKFVYSKTVFFFKYINDSLVSMESSPMSRQLATLLETIWGWVIKQVEMRERECKMILNLVYEKKAFNLDYFIKISFRDWAD